LETLNIFHQSIRGASGGVKRKWLKKDEFLIDGIGFLEIVIASFVFIYLIVMYNFLSEFFYPSIAMLNFLMFGFYMSKAAGYFKIKLDSYDLHAFLSGITAFSTIFIFNYVTVTFFNYDFLSGVTGAQGTIVTLSPIWLMFFYGSVGIAEEMLFTMFLFTSLYKGLGNPYLAAFIKSLMFAVYHQGVALQIFGMSIFKNTVYSYVLYIGSFLFALAFYKTKRFSTPATGHALLNLTVQLINMQVIRW